jgi:hypothetical protein
VAQDLQLMPLAREAALDLGGTLHRFVEGARQACQPMAIGAHVEPTHPLRRGAVVLVDAARVLHQFGQNPLARVLQFEVVGRRRSALHRALTGGPAGCAL